MRSSPSTSNSTVIGIYTYAHLCSDVATHEYVRGSETVHFPSDLQWTRGRRCKASYICRSRAFYRLQSSISIGNKSFSYEPRP